MRSQSHSNLRFIRHGLAVVLSIAFHVGIVRLRLPTPTLPVSPQVKTPSFTIPQQAVQVRPRPREHNQEEAAPPPTPTASPAPTPPPPAAQTSAPPPAPHNSAPPAQTSVAVESKVRSQETETPSKTQSKLSEEDLPEGDLSDVESDASSSSDPDPSQLPEQSLAPQWDGLISTIQAEEFNFGQAQSLQDIFLLYGQEDQFDLFFDQAEQPKIQILSYQLFTNLTPQRVWEEKVLPTLEKQDSIEITEDQMFAAGKVYRISQGEFVRYLNIVPLYRPQEVVLLEMAKPPFKEN